MSVEQWQVHQDTTALQPINSETASILVTTNESVVIGDRQPQLTLTVVNGSAPQLILQTNDRALSGSVSKSVANQTRVRNGSANHVVRTIQDCV